ncbi:MAG: HD domain-containing protein [Patescibacteria group bacterium]|nr:HD domain-containing protein [Patescibacteria group bacterium]
MTKIEQIKKIVFDEANEYERKFHFQPVINNAVFLAKKMNANLEIVELAAILHDIGKFKFGPKDHASTGAIEARKILKDFSFEDKIIEEIVHCVEAHEVKGENKPKTIEAEIIANADAMAHFDVMPYFFFHCGSNGKDFMEAYDWVIKKMDRDCNDKLTLKEAREVVADKLSSINLLLEALKKLM